MELPQDTVDIDITVEDFVTADSVKITINAVLVVEEGMDVRGTIVEGLKKISPGADWYFTGMLRTKDQANQELVNATVTARVKDNELNGIQDRITAAGRKGLNFTQGPIDYTPRQAQIEEANKKLRKAIYERANAEVELLNEVILGDHKWRVGGIEFSSNKPQFQKNVRALGLEASATFYSGNQDNLGGGEDGMSLTQKVTLSATLRAARIVYSDI